MGGADAIRGFLIQTMNAVLDSLKYSDWETVTTEPDIGAEKVDILWKHPNDRLKVVQVKSSRIQISHSQAKKWAEELKQSYPDSDKHSLVLIGPCDAKVSKIVIHDDVDIPPPLPNQPETLLEAAAYQVSSLLERESLAPLSATATKSIASQLVTSYFIKTTKEISRAELVLEIREYISGTGHKLRTEFETIIKALSGENEKQELELEFQKKQIQSLEATINEIQRSSIGSPQHKAALDALKRGDISIADSLYQEQADQLHKKVTQSKETLDQSTKELEDTYQNIASINIFADVHRAIWAYREATKLNESNLESWLQLGILLLRIGDFDGSVTAFENFSTLANDYEDLELRAKAYGFLGNAYLENSHPDKAEAYFRKIVKLANENSMYLGWIAQAHGALAKVHMSRGENDDALIEVNKALEIVPSDFYLLDFFIANQLSLKGLLYIDTDICRAERMLRESLRRFREMSSPEYTALQLNNIATIHRRWSEYPLALKCFDEAREINLRIGKAKAAAQNQMNIGAVHLTAGSIDDGKEALSVALHEAVGFSDIRLLAEILINLGLVYCEHENEISKAHDTLMYCKNLAIACRNATLLAHIEKIINRFIA